MGTDWSDDLLPVHFAIGIILVAELPDVKEHSVCVPALQSIGFETGTSLNENRLTVVLYLGPSSSRPPCFPPPGWRLK